MIEHGKKMQVSRHNYRVELTIINVTKADEENVHSLKITKRYLSMTIMLLLTLKGWSGDFISKEWALTILLINS